MNITLHAITLGWISNLADDIVSGLTSGLKGLINTIIPAVLNYIMGFTDILFKPIVSQILDLDADIFYIAQESFDSISTYNNLDNSLYSQLFTISENVFNVLATIGVGLCLLYFFMSIVDKLTKDRLTSSTLLRSFVELLFAVTMIGFSYSSLKAIANIGEANINGKTLANVIQSTKIADSEGLDVPYEAFAFGLSKNDMLEHPSVYMLYSVISLIIAFIYWVATILASAICITVVISRAIQTAIYLAFAPIPIANTFNRGSIMESSAVSYIKKIAALSLQGPIIVFILQAHAALLVGVGSQNIGASLPLLIGITFVTASLVFKSGQFANDIIS